MDVIFFPVFGWKGYLPRTRISFQGFFSGRFGSYANYGLFVFLFFYANVTVLMVRMTVPKSHRLEVSQRSTSDEFPSRVIIGNCRLF